MSEAGYTPIQLYHSDVAGHEPVAANLLIGELAINTADGKLFYEDNGGNVKVIASNVAAVANGGTGATTASSARSNLGAAASGANTDITALDQDVIVTASGTVAANSIGYRGIPASSQSPGSAITLALSDASQLVPNTSGGWVIPANGSVAFPVGTTIVLFNNSGSSQNVSITTDTLRWAGTTSTGTRALAAYGLATAMKVSSTVWVISGAGLS